MDVDLDPADVDFRSLDVVPLADTDGDGVDDSVDLDKDGDGILDVEEGSTAILEAGNASGSGDFVDEVAFFVWGADFADGVQPGDTETLTLPDGSVITATFTAIGGASPNQADEYVPSSSPTFPGAPIAGSYDIANSVLNDSTTNAYDSVSFTIQLSGVDANGNPFNPNVFWTDAERTDSGERWNGTTDGTPWEVVENIRPIGGSFVETGVGTQMVTFGNTNRGSNVYRSDNVSQLTLETESRTNGTGRQGFMIGILAEAPIDTDGDGISNHCDLDSDNDGISDLVESGNTVLIAADTDGDGVVSAAEAVAAGLTDADGDGVWDGTDQPPVDTDGDGVADYLDLDSDDDGIPDAVEAQPTAGYQSPSIGADADGDGIVDTFDDGTGDHGGNFTTPEDTDGDGTPDYLDTDSDNDGLDDTIESGLTLSGVDADGDGIDDGVAPNSYGDTDGVISNTGSDLTEADGDTSDVDFRSIASDKDGDGIADAIDLDDDNDGILDTVETQRPASLGVMTLIDPALLGLGGGLVNASGSQDISSTFGLPAGSVIVNWTNLNTVASGAAFSPATGSPINFTFTGTTSVFAGAFHGANLNPNGVAFDGIVALDGVQYDFVRTLETGYQHVQNGNQFIVTGDGTGTGDGAQSQQWISQTPATALQAVTTNSPNFNNNFSLFLSIADSDWDTVANHCDLDSDNDGISDLYESGASAAVIAADTDGDGTISLAEAAAANGGVADADGDGLMDIFDADTTDPSAAASVGSVPVDNDGDSVPDYLDLDSDNDLIPDTVEARPTAGFVANDGDVTNNDADGDGVIDIFDSNDTTTGDIGGTHANFNAPNDHDGDGTPDHLDTDSDNDSLSDTQESGLTGAGFDSDMDGIDDAIATNTYHDPDGVITTTSPDLANETGDLTEVAFREITDKDWDGIADALDLDSDNDGILDIEEGLTTQFTGQYNFTHNENGGTSTSGTPGSGAPDSSLLIASSTSAVIGAGLTELNSSGNPATPGNTFEFLLDGVTSPDLTTAIANDDYVELSFTTQSSFPTDFGFLDSIAHGTFGGANNFTDFDYGVEVSADGFATPGDLIISNFNVNRTNAGYNFRSGNQLNYQLDPGTTYSFRFYLFNDTGTGNSGTNGLVDQIGRVTFDDVFFNVSGSSFTDTDGDGISNHCDLDSDNDGISDLQESGNAIAIAADTNMDGLITADEATIAGLTDANNDGVYDQLV